MSGYHQGRSVEYAVMHDLKRHGWECTRAASSKGSADVIGIRSGHVALISVKRTRMAAPAERRALIAVADHLPGVGIPIIKPCWFGGMARPSQDPAERTLTYAASVRSRRAGSSFVVCFGVDFCIEKFLLIGDVGDFRSGTRSDSSVLSVGLSGAAPFAVEVLQPHFLDRGIAAVTTPHPQALSEGCGQTLRGLPGFRTGTNSLSPLC